MKLIDKDALVAEIEKYISNYKRILNKIDKSSHEWVDSTLMLESKIDVLQHILSFLNTLEVKEVDLNKELQLSFYSHVPWGDYCKNEQKDIEEWSFKIAKYFFELGLKTQKGG